MRYSSTPFRIFDFAFIILSSHTPSAASLTTRSSILESVFECLFRRSLSQLSSNPSDLIFRAKTPIAMRFLRRPSGTKKNHEQVDFYSGARLLFEHEQTHRPGQRPLLHEPP